MARTETLCCRSPKFQLGKSTKWLESVGRIAEAKNIMRGKGMLKNEAGIENGAFTSELMPGKLKELVDDENGESKDMDFRVQDVCV